LEIVTGAEPWFTRFTYALALRPTGTEPKATLEFEVVSPRLAAATLKADVPHPQRARPRDSIASDARQESDRTKGRPRKSPVDGIMVTILCYL
jgi:hypothetical protein